VIPDDFIPPTRLETPLFLLEPLGPVHNDSDYAAWSSSVEHIRSTPGFAGGSWPRGMTIEENLQDLIQHDRDFSARAGFTYTVLDPDGRDVVGCVYIYPLEGGAPGASVSSWVRASRAELDTPLWKTVSEWLASDWPFERVEYAPRELRSNTPAAPFDQV
jgi:hypothetical protein